MNENRTNVVFVVDTAPEMHSSHFEAASAGSFISECVSAVLNFVESRKATSAFKHDKYFLFSTNPKSLLLSSWQHSVLHFREQLAALKAHSALKSSHASHSVAPLSEPLNLAF